MFSVFLLQGLQYPRPCTFKNSNWFFLMFFLLYSIFFFRFYFLDFIRFDQNAFETLIQNKKIWYCIQRKNEIFRKQRSSEPLSICLAETWLKEQSNTKCNNLDVYQKIATIKRNTSKGGRIKIFVRMALQQIFVKKFLLYQYSNVNCENQHKKANVFQ